MIHQPSRRCFICLKLDCIDPTHLPADPKLQELELRAWVKKNAKELRKWDAIELADMACLCLSWIDKEIIHQVIPELHMDIQTHSTEKLRMDWKVKRETDHIECRGGKPQMEEQWHHLMHYENGQEWF